MNFLIFILIFIISCLVLNVVSNEYPIFIYSSYYEIYSSRLESNNTFKLHNISVFNENDGSFGMDYSINQNLIIYRSVKDENLYMSSIGLKSSDKKNLTSTDPYGHNIAIDWIHNLIYFNYDLAIHVMNISNNRMRAIIAKNELFGDIVVNPFESFIVWTRSVPNPSIIRTNQDGSNKTVLDDKDLINPFSIAIDFETKVIYFMDLNSISIFYKLFSIDFNGNDRKLIHQFKADKPSYVMSLDIYLSNLCL